MIKCNYPYPRSLSGRGKTAYNRKEHRIEARLSSVSHARLPKSFTYGKKGKSPKAEGLAAVRLAAVPKRGAAVIMQTVMESYQFSEQRAAAGRFPPPPCPLKPPRQSHRLNSWLFNQLFFVWRSLLKFLLSPRLLAQKNI